MHSTGKGGPCAESSTHVDHDEAVALKHLYESGAGAKYVVTRAVSVATLRRLRLRGFLEIIFEPRGAAVQLTREGVAALPTALKAIVDGPLVGGAL